MNLFMNTINLPGTADENEPVWLNMKDSGAHVNNVHWSFLKYNKKNKKQINTYFDFPSKCSLNSKHNRTGD